MASQRKVLMIAVVAAVALAGAVLALRHRGAAPKGGSEAAPVEYFCPMHPQIVRDKPGDCPVCGMKLERRQKGGHAHPPTARQRERKVLYYRHPMNPSVHSRTPAKDDMGMDYVPVYEEDAVEAMVKGRAAVVLPPERAGLLGIRSEPVGEAGTRGAIRAAGRVAVDERRREAVHVKYEGYVEKLHVNFAGQAVRRGQPLASIYSPELVAAQEEYLVARRAQARLSDSAVPGVAASGTELVDAARQRMRYFDVGAEELEALWKSGTPRRTVTLTSPAAGVVVEKMVVDGMRVAPADRLYQLADLSSVWVLADVYEKDLGAVRVGMTARITLHQAAANGEWRGRVAFISPSVKAETRTVEVRIDVENRGGALKPDMFTDVYLEGGEVVGVTVPESAVIQTGERALVFVDQGEGRYEPREVKLGARTPSGYAVVSGVSRGERVVVSANFLLDSESSLRAAATQMAGER